MLLVFQPSSEQQRVHPWRPFVVPADNCKDGGELFRQLNCAFAAFEIGPDAEDFRYTGRFGTLENLSQFLLLRRFGMQPEEVRT